MVVEQEMAHIFLPQPKNSLNSYPTLIVAPVALRVVLLLPPPCCKKSWSLTSVRI